MRENAADLAALQDLLDRSFARASDHLKSIMEPQRRLPAERIAAELPSPAVLNIATVTAAGEPRISAVDGHFIRGHWYFTTAAKSPKARQLRARPAISASYTPRDGYGVFCHGRVAELPPGDERQMVIDHFVETYGISPEELADGIFYARIDADWLVGFAMTAEEEVEIERARQEREARRAAAARDTADPATADPATADPAAAGAAPG
jgi:nitroimidazol reductase NimA-like FMN-containing flavoprotein (pyridoxamine 5'-phosphate oxidase superfamily)